MQNSKALLRKAERDILHEVNTFESDSLAKVELHRTSSVRFRNSLKRVVKIPSTSSGPLPPQEICCHDLCAMWQIRHRAHLQYLDQNMTKFKCGRLSFKLLSV